MLRQLQAADLVISTRTFRGDQSPKFICFEDSVQSDSYVLGPPALRNEGLTARASSLSVPSRPPCQGGVPKSNMDYRSVIGKKDFQPCGHQLSQLCPSVTSRPSLLHLSRTLDKCTCRRVSTVHLSPRLDTDARHRWADTGGPKSWKIGCLRMSSRAAHLTPHPI